MEVDDGQLIEQVLAGETDLFRRLVERYQHSIYRFAFGLLGDRHEAEEVSQEAFLSAFANLSRFDPSRSMFRTWLFTIVRNRCINILKRARATVHDNVNSIADSKAEVEGVDQDFRQQLDRALEELPISQKTAFVLAEIEELPYTEIAKIEQTSLGTVKSRIHRAKRQLRVLLHHLIEEPR